MAIYTLAADERVKFAKILAPGNTCDVTIAELLGELADDPAAATLCFLLESLADGRAFVERARTVTPNRPVVVVKTGKSEAGARAASSHTAALAADTAIWRGVFRQAGIVEVASGQELLDAARALDGHPLPAGPRVAIITNSGGVGVELSDLLADEGLVVPALSTPLQDTIRAMLPPFASPANPVDVTPVWSRFAELYPALTDLLARSGEVDVVVPVLLQRAALDAKTAEGLRDVVAGLRADDVRVPVHVCWVAPRDARPNADLLQDAGVPCFDWPARTARAIGHARRYAVARARTTPAAIAPSVRSGPTPTDPVSVAGLLAELGVDTAPSTLCRTADEAVAAATTFPVVVKLAEAAHRTELGGVRLDVADASGVRTAAVDLLGTGPGAGATAAVRGGDRHRGRARPGVRAGRDGRAGRDLGRGARRRRVRHGAAAPRRGPLVAGVAARRRAPHRGPRRPIRRPRRARRRRRRRREPAAGLPGRRRARPQPRARRR
jgi:acetyltransferase